MENESKLTILDQVNNPQNIVPEPTEELPDSFGYGLDTVEKARRWITNPKNWFKSELFILRWDGLLPRVCERHGKRLLNEPWDNGLAELVVMEQANRRRKKDIGEDLEQVEEKHVDEQ